MRFANAAPCSTPDIHASFPCPPLPQLAPAPTTPPAPSTCCPCGCAPPTATPKRFSPRARCQPTPTPCSAWHTPTTTQLEAASTSAPHPPRTSPSESLPSGALGRPCRPPRCPPAAPPLASAGTGRSSPACCSTPGRSPPHRRVQRWVSTGPPADRYTPSTAPRTGEGPPCWYLSSTSAGWGDKCCAPSTAPHVGEA